MKQEQHSLALNCIGSLFTTIQLLQSSSMSSNNFGKHSVRRTARPCRAGRSAFQARDSIKNRDQTRSWNTTLKKAHPSSSERLDDLYH